jgi:hypothetical protein
MIFALSSTFKIIVYPVIVAILDFHWHGKQRHDRSPFMAEIPIIFIWICLQIPFSETTETIEAKHGKKDP